MFGEKPCAYTYTKICNYWREKADFQGCKPVNSPKLLHVEHIHSVEVSCVFTIYSSVNFSRLFCKGFWAAKNRFEKHKSVREKEISMLKN